MKCSKCEKGEVVFQFTTIDRKTHEPTTRHLCLECAAELSPWIAKNAKGATSVDALIEELLKSQLSQEGGASVPGQVLPDVPACSECGLTFPAYKATLMLGCASCYAAFGDHLAADIRKLQGGADRHTPDSVPGGEGTIDRAARLAAMRAELQDCIENEDFERATYLRDQIKSLLAGDGAPRAESGEARPG